jgi:nitroreductase
MRNSPRTMTPPADSLLDALRWRYATKQFDATRRIPAEVWDAIEESLVLTPSSFGLQPWKFLVIQDPATRLKLLPESWNQPQVTHASHYVVLTARTDLDADDIEAWIERMAEVQNTDPATLSSLKGMIQGFAQAMSREARHEWNVRQVYIALGQLMASAAVLGIDACPMEGISASGYDHVLGLVGGEHTTVVACALGYRAASDKYAKIPKARFERSRVIEHLGEA